VVKTAVAVPVARKKWLSFCLLGRIYMKISTILFLLWIAPGYVFGQSNNFPICLTSQDVITNSVDFISNPTKTKETVSFYLANMNSTEVEAIARRHPQAKIKRDGIVVAESIEHGTVGLLGGPANTNYVGLVLYFDNYEKAELAAKTLEGK